MQYFVLMKCKTFVLLINFFYIPTFQSVCSNYFRGHSPKSNFQFFYEKFLKFSSIRFSNMIFIFSKGKKYKLFTDCIHSNNAVFQLTTQDTCTLTLHKKPSFPLRISSVNMTNSQFPADLVTFIEEILNGKLHFLCNVMGHLAIKKYIP